MKMEECRRQWLRDEAGYSVIKERERVNFELNFSKAREEGRFSSFDKPRDKPIDSKRENKHENRN
jgi:hypothetical protein